MNSLLSSYVTPKKKTTAKGRTKKAVTIKQSDDAVGQNEKLPTKRLTQAAAKLAMAKAAEPILNLDNVLGNDRTVKQFLTMENFDRLPLADRKELLKLLPQCDRQDKARLVSHFFFLFGI